MASLPSHSSPRQQPRATAGPDGAPPARAWRRTLALAGAGLLALGLATEAAALTGAVPSSAAPSATTATPPRQVLATEHTDALSVFLEGDRLSLATKADLGSRRAVRLDPDAVVFHVTDAALRPAPGSSAFAFLGVAPGTPVHVIPQAYTPGILWAGWNTESVPVPAVDGPIALTWEQVRGPGAVEVYESGLDGPERLFSSRGDRLRSLAVPANTHAHASWVFTAPGLYEIRVGATARSAQGRTLRAEPRTYVFAVGGSVITALPTAVEATARAAGEGMVAVSATVRWGAADQGRPPAGTVELLHVTGGVETRLAAVSATDGRAELTAASPGGGRLIARFLPREPQLVATSSTEPLPNPIAATSPQVTGLRSQYVPGDAVDLGLEGHEHLGAERAVWDVTRTAGAATERHEGWGLSLVAEPELDGADVVAVLQDADGATLGTAGPVRIRVGTAPDPTAAPVPTSEPSPTATTPTDPEPEPEPDPVPVTGPITAPVPASPPAVGGEVSSTDPECLPTPITESVEAGQVDVVREGHLDLGPTIQDGSLVPAVKDDRTGTPVWRPAGELVLHLGEAARTPVPAGGEFAFLGSGHVWAIPLAQRSGIPWLGWNTQHPTIAGRTSGPITMTLEAVDGPGRLAVYSLDSFGGVGDRYLGTVDGFPRSTAIPVGAAGAHVHGIWAFTEEGVYRVTIGFSGTVDGASRSGSTVLTFAVGDVDPSGAAQATTVTRYVGRTADGQECELDAGQTGGALAQTGLDSASVTDLGIVSGALLLAGIALTGLSTVGRGPRRRRAAA